MTVEDLSHASADRYTDRMIHDVHATSQTRFPPRPPPTVSAREILEETRDDTPLISARVEEAPSSSTERSSIHEKLMDFQRNFEAVEPVLSTLLPPETKKRIMRAVRGPPPMQRTEVLTIVVSIIVVLMTSMVCLSSTTRASGMRVANVPRATHSDGLSATTNYNIDRLMSSINPRR